MPPMQAQLAVTGGLPCSGEAIANLSDIKKPVSLETGSFYIKPGSDLLSHGNSHTIIGDALFHCCVRDGNRWCQSSMASRHKRLLTLQVS